MRKEAVQSLWQWREVILLFVVLGLSLWWVTSSFGLMKLIGAGLTIICLVFLYPTIQSARIPKSSEDAIGVVEVTERRIRYLGPVNGSEVALDDLIAVDIKTQDQGNPLWVLASNTGTALRIPAHAKGASLLYDTMSALPGVNFDQMVKALGAEQKKTFTIWRKT